MKQLTVTLTDFQYEKLEKLAAAKKRSIEECIRAFAMSCQPGGSGWVEPGKAGAEYQARKRAEEEAKAVEEAKAKKKAKKRKRKKRKKAKAEDAAEDVLPSPVE